jgi:hypothetical protein
LGCVFAVVAVGVLCRAALQTPTQLPFETPTPSRNICALHSGLDIAVLISFEAPSAAKGNQVQALESVVFLQADKFPLTIEGQQNTRRLLAHLFISFTAHPSAKEAAALYTVHNNPNKWFTEGSYTYDNVAHPNYMETLGVPKAANSLFPKVTYLPCILSVTIAHL